jgi:hypothetical protein
LGLEIAKEARAREIKKRLGLSPAANPKKDLCYLPVEQELETFFTLVTLNVLAPALLLGLDAPLEAEVPGVLEEVEVEAELGDDAEPFTSTSLLT